MHDGNDIISPEVCYPDIEILNFCCCSCSCCARAAVLTVRAIDFKFFALGPSWTWGVPFILQKFRFFAQESWKSQKNTKKRGFSHNLGNKMLENDVLDGVSKVLKNKTPLQTKWAVLRKPNYTKETNTPNEPNFENLIDLIWNHLIDDQNHTILTDMAYRRI